MHTTCVVPTHSLIVRAPGRPVPQIAVAVLDGPCYIRYINGNTACPGSTYQGLHVDTQGGPGMKLAVNFGEALRRKNRTGEAAQSSTEPTLARKTVEPHHCNTRVATESSLYPSASHDLSCYRYPRHHSGERVD